MASPPFNINQSLPGDTDIVSQHPPNARTFRDIVESWLGINHDTNGNHFRIDIPRSASPTTPAANIDVLYVSTRGRLKIKHPDGTEEFVGTTPGTIEYYTISAAPTGWLYANGGAVSRATYADLFDVISTAYGNGLGDGLTFSLPDLRGRSPIGLDDGASRISISSFGGAITTASGGGADVRSLVAGNIPSGVNVTVATSVSIPSISVNVNGSISGSASGQTAAGSITGTATGGVVTGTATGTVSGSASVTSSDALVHVGGVSDNYTSTAGTGTFNTPTRKSITSSGSISGSISATSLSGSLSGAATVSGSFTGGVTGGSVSGTFTGTGSGTGTGTGSGTGTTTGSPSGTAFSIIHPSMVLFPMIKT